MSAATVAAVLETLGAALGMNVTDASWLEAITVKLTLASRCDWPGNGRPTARRT